MPSSSSRIAASSASTMAALFQCRANSVFLSIIIIIQLSLLLLVAVEAGNPYGGGGALPPPVPQSQSQWNGGGGPVGNQWPVPNWPAPAAGQSSQQQQQQQYPQPVLPHLPQHHCYVYPCDPDTSTSSTSTPVPSTNSSSSTGSTSTVQPSSSSSTESSSSSSAASASSSFASSSTAVSAATGGAGLNQSESSTASSTASSSSSSPSSASTAGASSSTAASSSSVSAADPSSSTTAATNVTVGGLGLSERDEVVNTHNDLRASLANGTAQNMTGTMPSGTNIIQLAYNTSLETGATAWANQCTFSHASEAVRNASGENIYWTSNLTITQSNVLFDAAKFWWAELVQHGIQASLNFTTTESAKNIGHWTQMAWCTTSTLGCAVNVCSNATYVVCRYWPAGNFINRLVYTPGTRCQDCASDYGTNASCNANNGLCVLP